MVLRGIMVAFGLLAFHAAASVRCEKLHELLTDAEFANVFRTTRDNVPEYEVVPIMHNLYKRSTANLQMQFSAFGRDVDINLDPSDGLLAGENTPVWLASAVSNWEINYKKLPSNIVGWVAQSFVAPRSLASIVVDKSAINNPRFRGTIDDLTVAAFPARLQEAAKIESKRSKREVPSQNRTLTATDYHVIIKSKASSNNRIARAQEYINNLDDKSKPNTPKTVQTAEQEESQFHDDIRYQLAFWNSVDLRFRDLGSPKVRLRIAGIVIGQGRSATPYINNFLHEGVFDMYKSMEYMLKYWYRQTANPDFSPNAYNIIITLTDARMFDPTSKRTDTTGLAYTSSLCEGLGSDKFTAGGFVTDNMKFEGINTAAHELGHVLGAPHDTDDSGICAESFGYIMAPSKMRTLKMHDWSPCSLRTIEYFLRKDTHCADRPAEIHSPGKPIVRFAPGDILTDQQQCETYGYSYTCQREPKICEKLQCAIRVSNGNYYKWKCQDAPIGALDGTPCAPNAICLRGQCRRGHQIIR